LYVGKRTLLDYTMIATAVAAVLVWGTNRMRFFVIWILVTMLPVLFFTWGIASRYLYVPAAGFSLLLADLILAAEANAARWVQPRTIRVVATAVAVVLAVRFAAFAQEASEGFMAVTAPYRQLATTIRSENPIVPVERTVYVERRLIDAIPEIYRNAVAETALCTSDVRVVPR
jgi:hypothetical protein